MPLSPAPSLPETDSIEVYVPPHVAIIMDGNGRWALARGLPRFAGHRRGVEAVRKVVRAAQESGIRYLTLYAFSTENWSRPAREVAELLGLLRRFIRRDLAELHEAGVRVRIIGERENLTRDVQALLEEAESLTKNNAGLTLIVAFNYGARQEMTQACQVLAQKIERGELRVSDITMDTLTQALFTAEFPDPDLVIRTSGEKRLSNFLLWQAAYAEFVFRPEYWPDFDGTTLAAALDEYRSRERRFGNISRRTG
jgi:undecaprenyl diphosphate synthase